MNHFDDLAQDGTVKLFGWDASTRSHATPEALTRNRHMPLTPRNTHAANRAKSPPHRARTTYDRDKLMDQPNVHQEVTDPTTYLPHGFRGGRPPGTDGGAE